MVPCCVCQDEFEDKNFLEIHLATTHVFYTPYQCEFCQSALFPSDFALRRHYTNDHHQEVFNVIYRVSPELESKRNDLEQLISKSIATTSSTSSGRPKRMKAPKQDTDASTSQLAQFVFSDMHRFLKQANNETLNASFTSALDHPQGVYPGFSINNANNQQRYGNHEEFVSTPQTSLSQLISVSSGRNQGSAENGNLAGGLEEQQDTQGVLLTLNNRNSRKQKRDEETEEFGEMKYNDTLIASHKIKCEECHRLVGPYHNSMLLHISTHHCDLPIFECNGCGKQWFSLSARTKEHILAKHDGDLNLLRDNRNEVMPALKEKLAQCFPRKSQGLDISNLMEMEK